jgi:VacB/RNase II family 3'-5' exoribonuclease
VDRVVPMIPKRLSNNICSLKSGSDKLSYSAIFKIDNNGDVLESWFGRTIINVNKDYAYEDAQEVIENGSRIESKETDDVIIELDIIAKKMRAIRIKDSLEMNSIEVKFKLDDTTNKPTGVFLKQQRDSNKLVEEYMLLANKGVAKFIKSKKLPCVNRIHETPDLTKIELIKNFVSKMGYEFNVDENNLKSSLNKLIKDVRGTPEENIVTTLVTRSQRKAIYSTKSIGHYGLGFTDYCHFTSPIRRYSDILTMRLLSMALGNDGYPIK